MSARFRAILALVVACVALLGSGASWSHSHHTVSVAPIADGQPSTTSVVYDPQLLLLTLVLLASAGVLAVIGAAGLRRARSAATTSS